MKRKIIVVLAVALVVAAISVSAVFATDNGEQGKTGVIQSMFDAMRSWSQQAQDRGEITKEEAQQWDSHFKGMEKFHKENGLAGHCGGTNSGKGENQNHMPGYRNGMMGRPSGDGL
ncbi:MAG: hypothetical protein FIA99_00040 [Ruminiclostridium sp.]|nr:hypothetical protein [Ruminiclostridium sp.]